MYTLLLLCGLIIFPNAEAAKPTDPYPLTYLEMARIDLALSMIGQPDPIEVIIKNKNTIVVDITRYIDRKNSKHLEEEKRLRAWAIEEVKLVLNDFNIDQKEVKIEVNFDGVLVPTPEGASKNGNR